MMLITDIDQTTTTMYMTPEQKIIWCAGFFEASGRIHIAKPSKSDAVAMIVMISNTSPEALATFRDRIGCGEVIDIRTPKRRERRWQITGIAAGKMLENILPWLTAKRRLAMLGIEMADTVDPSRRKLTPETLQRRKDLTEAIRSARYEMGRRV